MDLSNRIKTLRSRLTRREIAKRLDVAEETVRLMERGTTKTPNAKTLRLLELLEARREPPWDLPELTPAPLPLAAGKKTTATRHELHEKLDQIIDSGDHSRINAIVQILRSL